MVADVIDLTDPYAAAALYNCFLICDGCGDEPASEAPARYNVVHYRGLGQEAKAQGWFVAPVSGTDETFDVFCAACASARGMVPNPNLRIEPSEALLTVAELASGSSDDVTPITSLERMRER